MQRVSHPYPSGAVMPKGWLLVQIQKESECGLIAHFDQIDETVTQNLFAGNKRDQGYVPSYHNGNAAKDWWSGEHEGYWKDAFIRLAFYSGNESLIQKAKSMVEDILVNAELNDGYIGIYTPQYRFNQKPGPDNGELWAQSRILLGLLAYFDFTKDSRVFDAIIKAVDLTIENYPKYGNYFDIGRGGGIAHGLMFADVCEELFFRTQNDKYAEFVLLLYNDFSESTKGAPRYFDLQKKRISSFVPFTGHGVHTAEHIRVPVFLYSYFLQKSNISHSNEDRQSVEEYKTLYNRIIKKLNYHSSPSGTLVCDEQVKGRKGSAKRHYEYCTIVEQFTSLLSTYRKFGQEKNLSWAESIFYNPGQGNRFSEFQAVTYLGADDRSSTPEGNGERYLYSARHAAAACCALNGGRLYPIFLREMWMKDVETGMPIASLFGPSILTHSQTEGIAEISEITNFPFSDSIKFDIKSNIPNFFFYLRIPSWASAYSISSDNIDYEVHDGFLRIIPKNEKCHFELNFQLEIEKISLGWRKMAIKRGPIFYTQEIPSVETKAKQFHQSGFYSYLLQADEKFLSKFQKQKFSKSVINNLSLIQNAWDGKSSIWENCPMKIIGKNSFSSSSDSLELIPFGSTRLRKFQFKEK